MIEINKGETTKTFKDGTPMTVRDLEIVNFQSRKVVFGALSELRILLFNLYSFVDCIRIDKKIFFTKEDYNEMVEEIKEQLKKNGLNLYQEK